MKMGNQWQRIAERLSEAGWSWRHVRLTDRLGRVRHVAEAHNEKGATHAVVAPSVPSAFSALDCSVKGEIGCED